jgi:hypothetical protein
MKEQIVASARQLVSEIYFGGTGESTWIVDHGADKGILGTIEVVSAEDASREPGPGKNSMVAHVNHLLFGLNVANSFVRGEPPNLDWESSWTVQSLDEAGWKTLQAQLRTALDEFLANADKVPFDNEIAVTAVMASVGHNAYHLGALRQLRP